MTSPATAAFQVDSNPTTTITINIGGHAIEVEPNATEILTAEDIASAINNESSPTSLIVSAAANATEAGQIDLSALNIGGDKISLSIESETGVVLRNSLNWTNIGSGGTNGIARFDGGSDTIAWSSPGGA